MNEFSTSAAGMGCSPRNSPPLGCRVTGVDASAEQVAAARERGLDARIADARALPFADEFDAVFSNATLHWIREADAVLEGVRRALRPGGRFVGEMGGRGNIAAIVGALSGALRRRGVDPAAVNPWYFPSPEDYRGKLEDAGFSVRSLALIPRPTALPGDLSGWLETFAGDFRSALPAGERAGFAAEVRDELAPLLRDERGVWIADYVRLRFLAVKERGGERTW